MSLSPSCERWTCMVEHITEQIYVTVAHNTIKTKCNLPFFVLSPDWGRKSFSTYISSQSWEPSFGLLPLNCSVKPLPAITSVTLCSLQPSYMYPPCRDPVLVPPPTAADSLFSHWWNRASCHTVSTSIPFVSRAFPRSNRFTALPRPSGSTTCSGGEEMRSFHNLIIQMECLTVIS